jgi:hypothetical protein
MTKTTDHRGFLYMAICLELMDLRQDIEFHELFVKGGYDWNIIVERLAILENLVADYADEHFAVRVIGDDF